MPTRDEADLMTLIRNPDGSVALVPWEQTPAEAVCPKCGELIRWALDMFSFTTGFDETHRFTLTHARCAWLPEAFDGQSRHAVAVQAGLHDVIGIRDAARVARVHENTIRNWIADGTLPAIRIRPGGYHRVRLADVLEVADAHS